MNIKKDGTTEHIQEKKIVLSEIYANAALTNFSPYEFELTLGLRSSTYNGVRPLINIRMSPQFAREFAEMLLQNIQTYEENFGTIILPERPRTTS